MEQFVNSMIGYAIRATDGDLGKVDGFYFDDESWTIRYMVVKTGNWLSGRKVLISLAALGKPDWKSSTFSVNLTRDQVKNSPDIDTQKPVYRQHETSLHEHYQWPLYWQGGYGTNYVGIYGGAMGSTLGPIPVNEEPVERLSTTAECQVNPHLRSTSHVAGCRIFATDGKIGHVEDFIFDDETWALRFLVVNAGTWLHGRKTLLSLQWVKRVEWGDSSLYFNLSMEAIEKSPVFDHTKAVTKDYVGKLHGHYTGEFNIRNRK